MKEHRESRNKAKKAHRQGWRRRPRCGRGRSLRGGPAPPPCRRRTQGRRSPWGSSRPAYDGRGSGGRAETRCSVRVPVGVRGGTTGLRADRGRQRCCGGEKGVRTMRTSSSASLASRSAALEISALAGPACENMTFGGGAAVRQRWSLRGTAALFRISADTLGCGATYCRARGLASAE